jgi:hypothetical protein
MTKTPFRLSVLALFILTGFFALGWPRATATATTPDEKQKLTAQEIILKHLDSLGKAEVRSKITTRMISGTCVFSAKINTGGTSTTDGPAVFASDGARLLLATKFNSPTYPSEQLAFDGKKVTTGYVKPGLRSTLGEFLISRTIPFKEGLLGGSLSSSWPFWELMSHDAKLELGGTKKIDGRDSYVIKYNPKKGSDFAIKVYFDAETFQHVRTEYVQIVAAANAPSIDQGAGMRESRYEMTEYFSDFKAEGGLMLPHAYKLEVFFDIGGGTSTQEWKYVFDTFTFNEKLDASAFNLENQPK